MDIKITPDQAQLLQDAGAVIPQLQDAIRKAKAAGLDVADLEKRLAQVEMQRAGLLREFGPGAGRRRGS